MKKRTKRALKYFGFLILGAIAFNFAIRYFDFFLMGIWIGIIVFTLFGE